MEGNFHVSFKPLTRLRAAGQPSKAEFATGKPVGLWYAKGTDWLPIMNRDLGAPIANAVSMELGLQAMVNAAAENDMASIYPEDIYIYRLQIEESHYTDSIIQPATNKVLRLSAANLDAFVNGLYTPWKTEERIIDKISLFFSKRLLDGIEVATIFENYFSQITEPDEEWYEEYQNLDDDEKDEYLMGNAEEITGWIASDLHDNFAAKKAAVFALDGDMASFVEKRLWAAFWNTSFLQRFAGVEFDASVVSRPDAPIWSAYLDIPSGCIMRPSALRLHYNQVAKLSLNLAHTATNMPVYGKVRNTRTVKRVRKARSTRTVRRSARK